MTSGIRGATVGAYANGMTKTVSPAKGEIKNTEINKETAKPKIEAIKEQIASGTYTIDIDKLAKKMAEELLP